MSVRIRNIQLRYIDKSATIDKKHGKEKFEKLIEIIKESGLYLVHEGGESYHIKIPGTKAEIEIFSTYNSFYPNSFVHIQLWMYDFFDESLNEKYRERSDRFKNIHEALTRIRGIIEDIKMDIKLRKPLEKAYGEDYVENVVNNR